MNENSAIATDVDVKKKTIKKTLTMTVLKEVNKSNKGHTHYQWLIAVAGKFCFYYIEFLGC